MCSSDLTALFWHSGSHWSAAVFVLRDSGGNTAATLGMMAVMLPAFFLGMYEKNGQPMEKLLSYYVQSRFVRPKIRPYKTNNYYALLMKGGATYDSVLEKDR